MNAKIDNKIINIEMIGKRIKYYRMRRNLSQELLGELADLSVGYISKLERGIKVPSLESLIKLANVLNVSSDTLLIDSLTHSDENEISELQMLLLDCNEIEERILLETMRTIKQLLYQFGI